jgi:hypothetical protein
VWTCSKDRQHEMFCKRSEDIETGCVAQSARFQSDTGLDCASIPGEAGSKVSMGREGNDGSQGTT